MSTTKMNTKEAATYIRKSVSWLNKSRLNGSGPVYIKAIGSVIYLTSDLDAWLNSLRRTAVYDFANDNERARAAA